MREAPKRSRSRCSETLAPGRNGPEATMSLNPGHEQVVQVGTGESDWSGHLAWRPLLGVARHAAGQPREAPDAFRTQNAEG